MKARRKEEILEYSDFLSEENERCGSPTGITLDFCGFEHCLPRHSYGPHIRQNYVIHVVIDGKGILDFRGKRWNISKDQMFILFPGMESTYYADKEDPWYYCWIGFQGESAGKKPVMVWIHGGAFENGGTALKTSTTGLWQACMRTPQTYSFRTTGRPA